MSADQVLKKSLMGGFKKEGVINYIEQLQAEIFRLKNEISCLNSEAEETEDLKKDITALKAQNEELAREIEAARSEKTSLIAESEILKVEKSALEEDIRALNEEKKAADERYAAEIENCKAEYAEKMKVCEEKISSIEAAFASIEATCSKSIEADAKAGEMLKEASVNSELIITKAQNKADAITEKANDAVAKAAKQVAEANERLKSACVNYDSSTVTLKASVDNLIAVLNSVSEGSDK